MNPAVRNQISPMEYTLLGIAWKRGPCTTYALMKELDASTSSYYKARASKTYPLVERLIASGLLAQTEEPGPRREKLVSVTERGVESLKRWLSDPIELVEVSHTVDLIRLRTFYLGVASVGERLNLIETSIARLQEQLLVCDRALAAYDKLGDVFSRLATEGVVFETKARIEWLTHIRETALTAPEGRPLPG